MVFELQPAMRSCRSRTQGQGDGGGSDRRRVKTVNEVTGNQPDWLREKDERELAGDLGKYTERPSIFFMRGRF
jgi:hypothetical protein